jgi:predicted enzyme related to lactoylglutathione lyase
MGKPVVHWELWSKDPEKISSFYAKLFGWKMTPQKTFKERSP